MPILVTTLTEFPNRRIAEVIGVVIGEGDGILDACVAMEDMANEAEADAVIDVRTMAVGAWDGPNRARIRWGAIGTAVRLEPDDRPGPTKGE